MPRINLSSLGIEDIDDIYDASIVGGRRASKQYASLEEADDADRKGVVLAGHGRFSYRKHSRRPVSPGKSFEKALSSERSITKYAKLLKNGVSSIAPREEMSSDDEVSPDDARVYLHRYTTHVLSKRSSNEPRFLHRYARWVVDSLGADKPVPTEDAKLDPREDFVEKDEPLVRDVPVSSTPMVTRLIHKVSGIEVIGTDKKSRKAMKLSLTKHLAMWKIYLEDREVSEDDVFLEIQSFLHT